MNACFFFAHALFGAFAAWVFVLRKGHVPDSLARVLLVVNWRSAPFDLDASGMRNAVNDGPLSTNSEGPSGSVDTHFAAVYSELKGLAASYLGHAPAEQTLQPTALINEAYLRLASHPELGRLTRSHFLALAALAMRQITINRARDRSRLKRGGGERRLTLHDEDVSCDVPDDDLVALDDAMTKLASLDARKARVVEMRFFGGMSVEEVGEALGVGTATVKRDWAMARAWLLKEMWSSDDPGAVAQA